MLELATIVRAAGPAYLATHAATVLPSQRRALRDISQCRTPALGGSLYQCDACGALAYRYHSCRNRHCPTCQADRAQHWLERVQHRLLPCAHYLLTFTLPAELRSVARRHQRLVYAALLREAARTVHCVAEDRAWIGGTPGILAVLHTWSRTLDYHPHVHLLVTAGGLTAAGTWIRPAHPRFLLPGYVLSGLFRAKMRDALARAGLLPAIDARGAHRVWQRRWTVHVESVGAGEHATLYLSRYVYRVALTNRRLTRFADGRVTFRYTHGRTQATHALTLPVDVFLTRFLAHVLPRAFTKVRWYGLLSPSRRADLERARRLLTRADPAPPPPRVASHTTTPPSAPPHGSPHAPPSTTGVADDPDSLAPPPCTPRCACAHAHWRLVHRDAPTRGPPGCAPRTSMGLG